MDAVKAAVVFRSLLFCLARVGGQGLVGVSRLHLPCLTVSSEMAPCSGLSGVQACLSVCLPVCLPVCSGTLLQPVALLESMLPSICIDPDSTGFGSRPC